MVKKVILVLVLITIKFTIFSESKIDYGLSLGLFYTEKDFLQNNSNIARQVDTMTLFIANMKFGVLIRGGYSFNPYLALGLESGVLFNSFQQNIPIRCYAKLGISDINIKPLVGLSVVREISYLGEGLNDISIGSAFDYGCRLEFLNLYFEYVASKSLSDEFLDSTKISFGYSLFFPNIR